MENFCGIFKIANLRLCYCPIERVFGSHRENRIYEFLCHLPYQFLRRNTSLPHLARSSLASSFDLLYLDSESRDELDRDFPSIEMYCQQYSTFSQNDRNIFTNNISTSKFISKINTASEMIKINKN